MYKAHPVTLLTNFLIFFITVILIDNPVVLLFIWSLLFIIKYLSKIKNHRITTYLSLIIILINIICGKIFFLSIILIMITYFVLVFSNYNINDELILYDSCFKSTNNNRTRMFISIIYYKKLFETNFKLLKEISIDIGYKKRIDYLPICLKENLKLTNKSIKKIIDVYEKKFYFSDFRNKYKIIFTLYDVLYIGEHLLLLVIIVIIRRML